MSIVRKGRIDPIEILREFIMQKKQIKFKKEKNNIYKIIFDNVELKSNMETAWKSSKSNREYNLGALWWFLECQLKGTLDKEYRTKALDMKIDFVAMIDQQEVQDYFTGKIDYTECINAERKSQLFKKQNPDKKTDEYEPGTSKKIKTENQEKEPLTEEEFKLKVIDEIYRFEKPINTRNRQLRVFEKSFEYILSQSKKILSGQYQQNEAAQADQQLSYNGSLLCEVQKLNAKPIIIIPAIYEIGNLCLKNVKQFLEEGNYVDPSTVKFTSDSRVVDISIKLKRVPNNVTFQVIEMPNTIDSNMAKRVVAIILRGSPFELKKFPNADNVNLLFKKIRGYHFKFEDEKVKDQLKQWGQLVKVFEFHRSKRHQDQSLKLTFWEDFEQFLLSPPSQEK